MDIQSPGMPPQPHGLHHWDTRLNTDGQQVVQCVQHRQLQPRASHSSAFGFGFEFFFSVDRIFTSSLVNCEMTFFLLWYVVSFFCIVLWCGFMLLYATAQMQRPQVVIFSTPCYCKCHRFVHLTTRPLSVPCLADRQQGGGIFCTIMCHKFFHLARRRTIKKNWATSYSQRRPN